MSTLEVTNENFKKEILDSDKPVLIDFFATWCGPCKMMSPVIDEIANEDTGIKICKIDIDESPNIASQYDINSVPTLVIIKDGKVTNKSIGAKPKNEILNFIRA